MSDSAANQTEVLLTSGLVMSQMMFTIFGTLTNNLVLITLKDLPDLSASSYHILLANMAFTNLVICTILKPAAAVYIGYSYAKMSTMVNLQFCQVYNGVYLSFLPIAPWSVTIMFWQLFFAGRSDDLILTRKGLRSVSPSPNPESKETPALSKIRAYHSVSRNRNPSQRKLMPSDHVVGVTASQDQDKNKKVPDDENSLEKTETERWLRDKAMKFGDGPRPNQIIILMLLWGAAVVFALENLDNYYDISADKENDNSTSSISSSYTNESSRFHRNDYCVVWQEVVGRSRIIVWILIVGVPLLLGPCLTLPLDCSISMIHKCTGDDFTDTSDRPGQRRVLTMIMLMLVITYSVNLLVAEYVFSEEESQEYFVALMVKYVLGSGDLIFTPLIVSSMDGEIKQGICYLFRRKRERPGTGYLR